MPRPHVRGADICRCCKLIAPAKGKRTHCAFCRKVVCSNCISKDRCVEHDGRIFCGPTCAEGHTVTMTQQMLAPAAPLVGRSSHQWRADQLDFSKVEENVWRSLETMAAAYKKNHLVHSRGVG